MFKESQHQVMLARKAAQQNNAILIFTIITAIFLPLSFFSSYFGKSSFLGLIKSGDMLMLRKGMNTRDIRELKVTQSRFWIIAGPISFCVVLVATWCAYRLRFQSILNWITPVPATHNVEAFPTGLKID